ncbi:MAG: respiratory nitrate reductase subunit gamma [Methylococcales bacterium]|nr:respiratory nitrate reductase subunit gamma [Methylococcales bacterium]
MSYLNTLFFGIYPYIALAVFFIASLIRYDRDQYGWRTGSSQMLRAAELKRGSRLFHIGILLLFFGHFFGLLTPPAVYHALGLSTSAKQIMAVIAGGVFGGICLRGLWILTKRRMTDSRIRATSTKMDMAILHLLLAQLALGLLTLPFSLAHSDGSTMLALAEWAQRIVTFRSGAAEAMAGVSLVYKAHIFLGLSIFVVFPFSRLVHVWSVPLAYVTRSYQIVRQR